MRWLTVLLLTWPLAASAGDGGPLVGQPSALLLADETVRFLDGRPIFTANQAANSSAATRQGLQRWSATEAGSAILARLSADEFIIFVDEDLSETAPGRAPQPSLAMLAAATDRRKLKAYEVVVNPALFRPVDAAAAVPTTITPANAMALAWAAEMLHVDFYRRGISLPHHRRADFQREWQEVAIELGFPWIRHDDEEAPCFRAPR